MKARAYRFTATFRALAMVPAMTTTDEMAMPE
jgi:hypothetical protein